MIDRPDISTHTHGLLIFGQEHQMERDSLFNKWYWKTGYPHEEK
jgi:hypothetical protein